MMLGYKKPYQIVICGGGNGAHATAGWTGSKAHISVNVLTRRPKDWKSELIVTTKGSAWEKKGEIRGKLNRVSDDAAEVAAGGTRVWLICGPAHIHETLLRKIAPHVAPGSLVGTLFAQGGFDWMCHAVFGNRLKSENITVFGLYNIPWICKATHYGERVRIIGPKDALYAAVQPRTRELEVLVMLDDLFDIPTLAVPNFLTLTLTPSNQIIHPGRIYGVFRDWDGKTPYRPEDVPFFYEDLDEFSGLQLKLLDDEIQLIKQQINSRYAQFDLTRVVPLKERIKHQYGDQVRDHSTVTAAFRTNQGYRSVLIPVLKVEGGVIPNTQGRIFWEDIPYGLCILHDLGRLAGTRTPAVDKMLLWHQQFMEGRAYLLIAEDGRTYLNPALIAETGAPSKYGITRLEQVLGLEPLPEQEPVNKQTKAPVNEAKAKL